MAASAEGKVAAGVQPKLGDYSYDLAAALTCVVGLRAIIPQDAFTADTLGTERTGNGVLIRSNGVVLTIGYLVTEAESIWIHLHDGRAVAGHVLGYDQETGFGLVQALTPIDMPALALGDSSAAKVGDAVVLAGAGGRAHSVAARVVARQEFAGYWEYVLDDAIFTGPSHPHWGGTALISAEGQLIGIGSLQLEQGSGAGRGQNLNMVVPIDLLKPIYDDLLTLGRPNKPPRPWLGLFATELEDKVVVVGIAKDGPAQRAKLRQGDIVLTIEGSKVTNLASLYRHVWASGKAGVDVTLGIYRDGRSLDVRVTTGERSRFLKGPRLH